MGMARDIASTSGMARYKLKQPMQHPGSLDRAGRGSPTVRGQGTLAAPGDNFAHVHGRWAMGDGHTGPRLGTRVLDFFSVYASRGGAS